jgi:hypothetical protein
VSLDDARSGATTPHNEPPPDYPGPSQKQPNQNTAHLMRLAAENAGDNDRGRPLSDNRRSSRGVGAVPQLPSLRLNRLPQIVIEPSSARPGDER